MANEKQYSSIFGKYHTLIKTIKPTTIGSNLNEFNHYSYKDFGYYKGGDWYGEKNSPAGFYVMYKGKWFVWNNKNQKYNQKKAASLNGKYYELIDKVRRPQDRKFYHEFVEYGWRRYSAELGKWIKSGYNVYVYPNWYIWEKMKTPENIPENAYQNIDYLYKYSSLLQVIYCPKDKENYKENYEYGKYGDSRVTPYCGVIPREGYWVYSFPNWYIWGKRVKIDDYREVDPNIDWPPKE